MPTLELFFFDCFIKIAKSRHMDECWKPDVFRYEVLRKYDWLQNMKI